METLQAIFSRCSVRQFSEREIQQDALLTVLEAGMSGPSAVNARDWAFIVIREKKRLEEAAAANGRAAEPLKHAAAGILICGDLERAYARAKDFWVIDGAIATQNMILAAQDLGIGSVWLGVWPVPERITAQKQFFRLPEQICPHSLLALGYSLKREKPKPNWEEGRGHWERW